MLSAQPSREEARRKKNRCFNDSLLPVTPKTAVTFLPQQYKNVTQWIMKELKCSLVNYTITFKPPLSHSNSIYEFFCPLKVNHEVIWLMTAHMEIGRLKETLKWSNKFSKLQQAGKLIFAQVPRAETKACGSNIKLIYSSSSAIPFIFGYRGILFMQQLLSTLVQGRHKCQRQLIRKSLEKHNTAKI